MKSTGVPGVGIGLIENGKVVFADGFGLRELGRPEKVDAATLFMVASNTKAMTTLMLGKLVDARKLTWETPVTELLPSFRLGDAATTAQVRVKHLICACTGLPRQDYEWLFQYEGITPDSVLATLGTMQPTSKFGEAFQYSNPLAAAAGFVGGHVAYPTSSSAPPTTARCARSCSTRSACRRPPSTTPPRSGPTMRCRIPRTRAAR